MGLVDRVDRTGYASTDEQDAQRAARAALDGVGEPDAPTGQTGCLGLPRPSCWRRRFRSPPGRDADARTARALGEQTLAVSTAALAGDDATYAALEAPLGRIAAQRDALAAQMIALLDGAEFHGRELRQRDVRRVLDEAEVLLDEVHVLSRHAR